MKGKRRMEGVQSADALVEKSKLSHAAQVTKNIMVAVIQNRMVQVCTHTNEAMIEKT